MQLQTGEFLRLFSKEQNLSNYCVNQNQRTNGPVNAHLTCWPVITIWSALLGIVSLLLGQQLADFNRSFTISYIQGLNN